jgi:hypothetical protein
MVRLQRLLSITVPVVLAGCSGLVTPIDLPTTPGPTAIRVSIVSAGPIGRLHTGSTVRFVRITGVGTDIERRFQMDGQTRVELPGGGVYRVGSWARPCAGTCRNPDRSADRCFTSFTATAGHVIAVEIDAHPSKACTIHVSG